MRYILGFIFSLVLLLNSCTKKEKVLLSSLGIPGKLLIVNYSDYPTSRVDSICKTYLSPSVYGLPQQEDILDITVIEGKSFSKTFRAFRNIILIQGNKTSDEVLSSENIWATQQWVAYLNTTSQQGFQSLLQKHSGILIQKILEEEQERLIEKNKSYPNIEANQWFSQNTKSRIFFQDGFDLWIDTLGFSYFRLDRERTQGGYTHQITQGLWYTAIPYESLDQLKQDYLLAFRDSLLKSYIHGTVKGSYMETSRDYVKPFSEQKQLTGGYVIETRGLWRMKDGVSMGGPFINCVFVDTARQKLHIFDGSVYAPNFKKRDYLRELEAIIYSFNSL